MSDVTVPNDPPKKEQPHGIGVDIKRLIKEVSKEARKSRVPLYIAVVATILAFVSMAEGDAKERALGAQIEAANQFAFFQAKNIRKTDSEIAADVLTALEKPELAKPWRTKADTYAKEKAGILKSARAEQAKRKHALKQAAHFEIAIALLQISIVLATASLIIGGGVLLGGSIGLTLVAVFFAANGYGLFFEFPTDPGELWAWITAKAAEVGLIGTN
jgi:Domain of unknown function (DUF4337)